MRESDPSAVMYRDHLRRVTASATRALSDGGFDHLLVAAGVEKTSFLDDRPYPFRANPHFKHWLPLGEHPGCWIAFTPGERPRLVYVRAEDFWHLPAPEPEGDWLEHFDVRIVADPRDAVRHLPTGRCAVIGEADAGLDGVQPQNPPDVLARLHWDRACKSAYELSLLRAANARAVAGHRAARDAFVNGASELDIHRAYLAATGHTDLDLPYHSIVGLDTHAAVLHYQHRVPVAPDRPLSLLIDAGAEVGGYCADITRTWSGEDARFSALVDDMDGLQQSLVDGVRPGTAYTDLHLECHRGLAALLERHGIVRMPPEDQVEAGITRAFFPHGLGHFIGLQVHDVGGHQATREGGVRAPPAGDPFLRLTRTLEPGHVVTVEPGLYFIDRLLAMLAEGPHAARVDWPLVEHLGAFGGIRIEDDVACTASEPENLSRNAFAAA